MQDRVVGGLPGISLTHCSQITLTPSGSDSILMHYNTSAWTPTILPKPVCRQ